MEQLARSKMSAGAVCAAHGRAARASIAQLHRAARLASLGVSHAKTQRAARELVRLHAASPVEIIERSAAKNGHGNGHHAADVVKEAGQAGAETEQELFDWAKAWYPLAIEADLPTDRPTPMRLLGQGIVLWKDGENVWRAFQDLCPHRLAPLSEGRVENGELMCSYHGWQFRGSDGRATVIPQAADAKAEAAACASRRSCVQDGLVWVWGSTGPEAEAEAAKVPVVNSPGFAEGKVHVTPWFMRELPYDVEILCENVLDPSHVPFSHHGVQGNRFKPPKLQMSTAEVSPRGGASVRTKPLGDNIPPRLAQGTSLSFGPPTLLRYAFAGGNELMTHAVPTDPGRCKLIFTLLLPKDKLTRKLALMLKVLKSRPLLWFDHFERNEILDGDNVFLAFQEQELRARAINGQQPSGTWSKAYYMPTSLDNAVQGFRRWQAQCAKPIPWAPTALPPPSASSLTREQLLNRWEQHCKHCPSCAGAHRNFSLLKQAGIYAAIVAAAYAAFQLGNRQPLSRLLAPVLAGLAAAGLAALSNAVLTRLTFKDYKHPER